MCHRRYVVRGELSLQNRCRLAITSRSAYCISCCRQVCYSNGCKRCNSRFGWKCVRGTRVFRRSTVSLFMKIPRNDTKHVFGFFPQTDIAIEMIFDRKEIFLQQFTEVYEILVIYLCLSFKKWSFFLFSIHFRFRFGYTMPS